MPSKKKKYNSRFPPARIKKIMQTDEEVGKVAAAVPVIISRALELFIESLILKANETTVAKNAKTLTTSHIKQTIEGEKKFDFLKELVSAIPDHQPEDDGGADNSGVSEVKKRGPRGPRKSKDGPGRKRKDRKSSSESSEANANDDEETETDEEEEDNNRLDPPVTSPTTAAPSTSQLASPLPNQQPPTAHIPLSHIPDVPSMHTQMPSMNTQMPSIHTEMPSIHTEMPSIHTQMPSMNTQMPFNSLPYQMNTVSPTMPAMGMPSVSSFSLPPKQIVEDDDYDA